METTVVLSRIYCEMDRRTNLIDDTRLAKNISNRIEKGLNPLVQAIALRPTDREGFNYEVADGRRRFKALQSLNYQELRIGIDATVANGDLEMIAFVANDERLNLSLSEQVEKLATLIRKENRTLEELGTELGRSPAWIAKRINLLNLCKVWKEALKKNEFPRFTVAHYEAIAGFPEETQTEIHETMSSWYGNKYRELSAKKFLSALHRDYAVELSALPWHEDGCGTCPACRERAEGGYLFADLGAKPRCMNRAYINDKRREFIAAQIQEDVALIAVSSQYTLEDNDENAIFSPLPTKMYNTTAAKDGKKAILVDGPNAGKIITIDVDAHAAANSEQKEKQSRTLAERKALKMKQRKRHALEKFLTFLDAEDCPVPGHEDIYALAACMGLTSAFGWRYEEEEENERVPAEIRSLKTVKALPDLDKKVWNNGLKHKLYDEIKSGQKGPFEPKWDDAEVLSELLHFDLAAALTEATEALPDPKAWAALETAESKTEKHAA